MCSACTFPIFLVVTSFWDIYMYMYIFLHCVDVVILGGGALTCIGGTGTCRFDDPLFQTPISVL